MKKLTLQILGFCAALTLSSQAFSEAVVGDDVASISRAEMQATVERWPADMRAAATTSLEHRRELATLSLAAKKVALAAQEMTPEDDPKFYWDLYLQIQMMARRMLVKHHLDNMEYPDMEPLAQERYAAEKDKYAKVAERRLSSHILFSCTPGDCDVEETNRLGAEVLEALRGGADFEAMVQEHSDDEGTKARGGEFRWVTLGQTGVSRNYTKAVFEVEEIGGYSELFSSRYGLHILRLDGIEPSSYKSYEDVKGKIIQELKVKYRQLAAQEFDKQYAPVGELVLDEAALDEIFAPYQEQAREAGPEESAEPASARQEDSSSAGDTSAD